MSATATNAAVHGSRLLRRFAAIWPTKVAWRCQRLLYAPSARQPPSNNLTRDIQLSCPVGDALRFPAKGKFMASASVSTLFAHCRPSHIFRLVVSVVIYAINRVFGAWPWPNVKAKRRKRPAPSRAHPNSTTTIPVVMGSSGVFTATDHRRPHTIKRSFAVSVCCVGFCAAIPLKAPARTSVPATQRDALHGRNRPTVAHAPPICLAVAAAIESLYDQSAKTATTNIFQRRHFIDLDASGVGSHIVLPIH